jgi:hypothetical protein
MNADKFVLQQTGKSYIIQKPDFLVLLTMVQDVRKPEIMVLYLDSRVKTGINLS